MTEGQRQRTQEGRGKDWVSEKGGKKRRNYKILAGVEKENWEN